jgi:DNA-binding NarL/FixJ family response regulator
MRNAVTVLDSKPQDSPGTTRPVEPAPDPRTGTVTGGPRSGPVISVIVVAAERLFRLGLARLLNEDERIDVIEVSDGDEGLVELCAASPVDVVLVDLEVSRADGVELIRQLSLRCPGSLTLALTSNIDWRVRPTMLAGAAGVLHKDTSPEAIGAAVVSVHLGHHVLSHEASRWALGDEPSTHLTQRESDVLRMVARGASNAEIAMELQLGQKTVRNYVSRLYRKLELTNRAQIATYLARTDSVRAPDLADVSFDAGAPSAEAQ